MYVCIAPWILIQEEIHRNPTLILMRGSPTAPKTSMEWPLRNYPFSSSPHLTNTDLPSELSVSAVVQVLRLWFSDCLCIDQIIFPGGKNLDNFTSSFGGALESVPPQFTYLLLIFLSKRQADRPHSRDPETPSRALHFGCDELSVCGPLKFRSLNRNPWHAGTGDGPLGGSWDYMRHWGWGPWAETSPLRKEQPPSAPLPHLPFIISFLSSPLLLSLSFIRIQRESGHLQVLNGNQISWHIFFPEFISALYLSAVILRWGN